MIKRAAELGGGLTKRIRRVELDGEESSLRRLGLCTRLLEIKGIVAIEKRGENEVYKNAVKCLKTCL